jgi:hypothetical protein
MYWFRAGTEFEILAWLALLLAWWAGGWLIASHAFQLAPRERPVVGFGIGLGLYLWLANVLAYLLPAEWFLTAPAGLVLVVGVLLARRSRQPFRETLGRLDWHPLLLAAAGGWVFLQISQGIGIFDEYIHLPLISTMAAGNVPPRHVMNAEAYFAYHYGFNLLGASLVRVGGLFPWSAFDLSKALLFGAALAAAWSVGQRYVKHRYGGLVAAGLLAFAGGTRYLMLLLPPGLLARLDALVHFQENEAALGFAFSESLSGAWLADGGPPAAFPFAFLSGLAEPLVMSHAGLNLLNVLLFLLAWLLMGRSAGRLGPVVLALLLALWALTWETSYAVFAAGSLAALLLHAWQQEAGPGRRWLRVFGSLFRSDLGLAVLLSLPIILLQGGVATELLRGWGTGGGAGAGFSLRWPPAVLSRHLGALSLFEPLALLVIVFEFGPLLFFVPSVTRWAWARFQAGEVVLGAVLLGGWFAFLAPVFVAYETDQAIARLTSFGFMAWLVLLGLMVWERSSAFQGAAVWALGLSMVSGLVVLASGLTGAGQVAYGFGYDQLDARIGASWWDRLPNDVEIFDAEEVRASTLTGRLTHLFSGVYSFSIVRSTEWEALTAAPSVDALLAEGFSFVYADEKWWRSLPEDSVDSLEASCVAVIAEEWDDAGIRFRRLLDLRGCSQQPVGQNPPPP